MKKLVLFIFACFVLLAPLYKLLDYSVTAYEAIAEKLYVFQSAVSQKNTGDEVACHQLIDKNFEAINDTIKSVEILITMYNRIVSVLALSLIVLIGLAIWRRV